MKKNILFFVLLSTISTFSQIKTFPVIPYREGNLWGFCNIQGKIIVKPYFEKLIKFSYDSSKKSCARFLIQHNGNQYVINEKNIPETPINIKFDSIVLNKNEEVDFIRVYKLNKVGLCKKGKLLIPCEYDKIETTQNGSYKVEKNNLVGIINSDGKKIVPVKYKSIYEASKEKDIRAEWVATNENWDKEKFFDYKTPTKTNEYFQSHVIEEFFHRSKSKEQIKNLEDLYKSKFDRIEIDSISDFAIVHKDKKFGIINLDSNELSFNCEFDKIESLNFSNRFKAKKDNKLFILYPEQPTSKELPFEHFSFDEAKKIDIGYKSNLKGVAFTDFRKDIDAKYLDINYSCVIRDLDGNYFDFFEVLTANKKTGFVGENGVEFFKD